MARRDEVAALHVRISPRLLERVDTCSREQGISRAEFVRTALAAAADRAEGAAERRERLARSAAVDLPSG